MNSRFGLLVIHIIQVKEALYNMGGYLPLTYVLWEKNASLYILGLVTSFIFNTSSLNK